MKDKKNRKKRQGKKKIKIEKTINKMNTAHQNKKKK